MATHTVMVFGGQHVRDRFGAACNTLCERRSAFKVATVTHQGVQPTVQARASIGERNERCRIGENLLCDPRRQLAPNGQDSLTGQLRETRDDVRRVRHL